MWDRHRWLVAAAVDLCLIGVMATFGWEKALGDAGELGWWEDAVAHAAAR